MTFLRRLVLSQRYKKRNNFTSLDIREIIMIQSTSQKLPTIASRNITRRNSVSEPSETEEQVTRLTSSFSLPSVNSSGFEMINLQEEEQIAAGLSYFQNFQNADLDATLNLLITNLSENIKKIGNQQKFWTYTIPKLFRIISNSLKKAFKCDTSYLKNFTNIFLEIINPKQEITYSIGELLVDVKKDFKNNIDSINETRKKNYVLKLTSIDLMLNQILQLIKLFIPYLKKNGESISYTENEDLKQEINLIYHSIFNEYCSSQDSGERQRLISGDIKSILNGIFNNNVSEKIFKEAQDKYRALTSKVILYRFKNMKKNNEQVNNYILEIFNDKVSRDEIIWFLENQIPKLEQISLFLKVHTESIANIKKFQVDICQNFLLLGAIIFTVFMGYQVYLAYFDDLNNSKINQITNILVIIQFVGIFISFFLPTYLSTVYLEPENTQTEILNADNQINQLLTKLINLNKKRYNRNSITRYNQNNLGRTSSKDIFNIGLSANNAQQLVEEDKIEVQEDNNLESKNLNDRV